MSKNISNGAAHYIFRETFFQKLLHPHILSNKTSFLLLSSVLLSAFLLTTGKTSHAQNLEIERISIYFNSDVDQIDFDGRQKIRSTILKIGSDRIKEIHIEGHADSDATDTYNIELSSRRANNAKDFLLKQGVKDQMILLDAFGESKPSSENKAENRRVDITFVYGYFNEGDNPTDHIDGPRSAKKSHLVIKLQTFVRGSDKILVTDYVLDKNGKSFFGSTKSDGSIVLGHSSKEASITFSKEGYLSVDVDLSKLKYIRSGDTLYKKIMLYQIEVVEKLQFKNIFFFTDSDDFRPESIPELKKLLKVLQQSPDLYIEIQGHMNFAQNRPASPLQKAYNQELSHRRARAVRAYLIQNGISSKRLTFKGMSNFKMIYPIPQNKNQEDMNKRVEVWTLNIVTNPK